MLARYCLTCIVRRRSPHRSQRSIEPPSAAFNTNTVCIETNLSRRTLVLGTAICPPPCGLLSERIVFVTRAFAQSLLAAGCTGPRNCESCPVETFRGPKRAQLRSQRATTLHEIRAPLNRSRPKAKPTCSFSFRKPISAEPRCNENCRGLPREHLSNSNRSTVLNFLFKYSYPCVSPVGNSARLGRANLRAIVSTIYAIARAYPCVLN
jgi:hypothetical protein